MSSLRTTSSLVIVETATNKAVFETFNRKIASAINTNKYKAVPILEYLQGFNKSVRI